MSLFSIITDAIKASDSSQKDKLTNLNTTQNLRITTTFFNGEQTNAQQTAQPLTINTKEQNEDAIKALGQRLAEGQQTQPLQESHFDRELKEINLHTSTIPNKGFKLKEFPKSPDEMTRDDYESVYVRAMLGNPSKEAMSDTDVISIVNKMRTLDGKRRWNIDASLEDLRSDHKKYGQITVATSDRQIAEAFAGKRAVLRENQEAQAKADLARTRSFEDTNKIFADGYKRWAAMHADVPIQAFNIVSEPVRGVGNSVGVEVPRVPTVSQNVRSEVFDNIDPSNNAPRMAASVFLMAKAPSAVETKAGQVYAGVDSVYNVGAGTYGGLTGKNIAEKDANGEYAVMGPVEAALRVTGGVLGGYGLRSEAKNTFSKMREGTEKLVPTGQAVVTTDGEVFPILRPSANTIKPKVMPGTPGQTVSGPIVTNGVNELLKAKPNVGSSNPISTNDVGGPVGVTQQIEMRKSTIEIAPGVWSARPDHVHPRLKASPANEPIGIPESIPSKADADQARAITRQNESAKILAKHGYYVEQQPAIDDSYRMSFAPWLGKNRRPDYRIEKEIFDCYSPRSGTSVGDLIKEITNKIDKGQTRRIVLNLEDNKVNLDELHDALKFPIKDLQEIIVINDGNVIPLYPK